MWLLGNVKSLFVTYIVLISGLQFQPSGAYFDSGLLRLLSYGLPAQEDEMPFYGLIDMMPFSEEDLTDTG